MRECRDLGLRSWVIPSTIAYVLLLSIDGGAGAQTPQAPNPSAPTSPGFELAANSKVALEYSTIAKDNGAGFKVGEFKSAAGSESLTIKTLGRRHKSVKITLKFTFKGDSGSVTIPMVVASVADDGKGQYVVKFTDTPTAELLKGVVGKLNNSIDAGKSISLEKCEVSIEFVPGNESFTKEILSVQSALEHVQ